MLVIEKMKAKENFTNLEQQITDYILEHPRDMMSLSLKDLAQNVYMSKATVIRYYKKLGFSSYRAFCVELAKELNYYPDYDDSEQLNTVRFSREDSIDEVAEKILQVKTNALKVTHEYLDVKTIRQVLEVIEHYDRLYIYGFGSGGVCAARNFEAKMIKAGKEAITVRFEDWYIESYRNYSRDSCMILIGYNDQDNRIASLAKKVNEENIPIILLTGPYKNEIDQYAHLILRTSYAEEKSIPGSLGSLTAMDYLISVLFTAIMR